MKMNFIRRKIKLLTASTILSALLFSSVATATTINADQMLKRATQYIAIAEQYKTGVGTAAAARTIALLPDGPEKTDLTKRLQVINDGIYEQRIITATKTVENAEKLNNAAVANNSLMYVALLKEGEIKDDLIQRVYNISTTPRIAERQVWYVEIAKDNISFKRAQMHVNAIKDDTLRENLQNRLDKIVLR